MIILIDKHNGIPIYRQVMDHVARAIMSGQLNQGDQLESVAQLSKRLQVNPMTISKAYSFLVEEELIERRAGIGLFVSAVHRDKKRKLKNSLLSDTLRKSAAMAVQLGLDEDEARDLFLEYFKQIKSRQGGAKK